MIKSFLLIAILALVACSHNPQPLGKPLPVLTYAHLHPIAIHRGAVRVQQSFRPSAQQQAVLKEFRISPAEILKKYAQKRFVLSRNTGISENLVFDVQDASITKLIDENNLVGFLSGSAEDVYIIDVLIHMTPIRTDGHRSAPFKVAYKQRLSLPQNMSLAEREFRQFEAVERMMASVDKKIIEMIEHEMTPDYF